jgi:hypothetical protein
VGVVLDDHHFRVGGLVDHDVAVLVEPDQVAGLAGEELAELFAALHAVGDTGWPVGPLDVAVRGDQVHECFGVLRAARAQDPLDDLT